MLDRFNEYFLNKGINVSYNTLGATKDLVYSYLNDFSEMVKSSGTKKSQDIKFQCYSSLYSILPRDKKTGFEQFLFLDKKFRADISSSGVTRAQNSNSFIVDGNVPTLYKFKDELISHVSKFQDVLLYLSGGLDSEIVARSLLEAGVSFIPVIFQLKDNEKIQNQYDFEFAMNFCQEHNLKPLVKSIDIPSLWSSTEFHNLALDMQVVSTQILTHAYMVKIMDAEFPNKLHVFGGEVRFFSNYILDDGRDANLVQLGKLVPGYSGNTYVDDTPLIGPSNAASLTYTSSSGAWNIVGSVTGTPTSGTWTDTPSSVYEYQITSVTVTDNYGPGTITPAAPTGWTTISGTPTICEVSVTPTAGRLVTFGISVRVVGQTTPVQTSTIELGAYVET